MPAVVPWEYGWLSSCRKCIALAEVRSAVLPFAHMPVHVAAELSSADEDVREKLELPLGASTYGDQPHLYL